MLQHIRYTLLILTIFLLLGFCTNAQNSSNPIQETYQCIPCGYDCDKESFDKPGKCGHCKMELVKKSTVSFKSIEPTEICKYLKAHPNVILLDVRTKEEFDGKASPNFGSLKGAINIPIQELEKQLDKIAHLKGADIIVYCSHSHRSPRASYLLSNNGFVNITNMAGGISKVKDVSCKE